MKLQFKEQDFQLNAVNAVVSCFVGQALKTNRFTMERRTDILHKAKLAASTDGMISYPIQEEIGYRNSPIQISEAQLLKNIQEVQSENDLFQSEKLERPKGFKLGCNLTIEMETGTGKTYTYIRTMYELHKKYGWSKFIVIVPSIAIREGVLKSFEDTQDHFQEIFGHKISPFIYNSSSPTDIENFASDNRISVMIINTQAFNARGADARRIFQELDQFSTRRPIDIIAETNPILIIDEPQSVDGPATLQSMQEFKPLFTLRYSATHKIDYNKVFRLDALDAYHKKLVKKIQVKGINLKSGTGTSGYLYLEQIVLSTTKPPMALIEFEIRQGEGVKRVRKQLGEKSNLFELSGGIPAYKDQVITEINGQYNKVVIAGQEIYPGDVLNDKNELDFRRIQIRETIQSHLQKEKQLFSQGVKVLSLFFIDSVEKYRVYDPTGEETIGEYARIFEEEYNKLRSDFLDLFKQEFNDYLYETDPSKVHEGYLPSNYKDYLERDQAARVHEGYFSIDKKKKLVDPKLKRGSEESDDISAFDLIMKRKDLLMSFQEPVRFIFSHSALKEGWDNPNVFQICALKNPETGSQARRRQEVGRGMRLCVNAQGNRLDFDAIGDQVHEVNSLTIVASESFESFAKGLQSEIANSIKDRPRKAEAAYFTGKVIEDVNGVNHRITKDEADKIIRYLIQYGIVNAEDEITPVGKELIAKGEVVLPENLDKYKNGIISLLRAVYTGEGIAPENARKDLFISPNQNFSKKEFQELWNKINFKSIYEVQFDTAKLIKDSKIKIDAQLHIADRSYQVKTGELKDGTVETLKEGKAIVQSRLETQKLRNDLYTNTLYDIVGEIEKHTQLTRKSIVEILKQISPAKFILLRKNPEEFIAKCAKLINEVKASLIINNIVYHKLEEQYDAKTIFTNDNRALRETDLLKKHIYDYMSSDSNVESNFVKDLEAAVEVIVYAKLPKTFTIATPIAKFSPDWAIVFDKEKVRHIYFVAETKGSDSDQDLREIEKLKIHCASKHFEEISNAEVKFNQIASYDKLLDMVQLK